MYGFVHNVGPMYRWATFDKVQPLAVTRKVDFRNDIYVLLFMFTGLQLSHVSIIMNLHRLHNRRPNRKIKSSTAPIKAKSQEPAYSQAHKDFDANSLLSMWDLIVMQSLCLPSCAPVSVPG